MTNEQIEARLVDLIKDERRLLNEILALINQAEARDIPLTRGFASTYGWLTRGLGYSNAAAYRRLEAARLLRVVPEIREKLETGALNLTTVAKARGAIKAREKISGQKMSAENQAEILVALEHKTSADADRTLLELMPDIAPTVHQERVTRVGADRTRVTLNLTDEDLDNLAWAKDYLSHAEPTPRMGIWCRASSASFALRNPLPLRK